MPKTAISTCSSSLPEAGESIALLFCFVYIFFYVAPDIVLISFSRLYLGVHWFSDIVAGMSFGVVCIVSVALLHHLGDGNQKNTLSLGVAAIVTLLLSASIYIFMEHNADLIRYAPR